MTIKQILFIGLTVISALSFHTSSGQNLDTIKIDNKQSILNDRAFFLFPTYAINAKRGVDIMSADPNANEETRIVLDIEEMRLVFFAQELYSIGDNNLFASVSKDNEKGNLKTKILTDKDSVQSILSTPTKFDSTKNAILVNSLLVRTQDNSIFRINAYINPGAYKLKDQFQKLTENVFSTLTKGTRTNKRTARQESLSILGGKKSFTFNIPADYCITTDQQYDFQVYKFHKYQNFSDTNWIQLIIYTGFYPSPVYKDYSLSESDGKKVEGKFLGKNISWLVFDISKEGFIDKEQKIPCNNIEKNLIVHVAMLSNQQKSIDDLTKIVEQIKLTE
ncbi:MAG TPA: hypothetical protein VE978_23965 [Chitinophagales bacterium]|nr:hypothetical protein [Chitinophagales bacterium]